MTVTWEELGWERLAAGVGRCRLPGWDCTAGLVVGADTALLVDAGSSLAEGAWLQARARELAGHRVTHLALTHPHFDHVFGAAAFAGAEVYGAVGVDTVLGARQGRAELRADAVRNGLAEASADEAVGARWCRPGTMSAASGRSTWAAGARSCWRTWARATPPTTSRSSSRAPREVVFCGDLVEESGRTAGGPGRRPARTGRPPSTGCWSWAARTRCTSPVTERWWTRRSSGPSGTRWRRVSACRERPRGRLLLSSSECASTPPT